MTEKEKTINGIPVDKILSLSIEAYRLILEELKETYPEDFEYVMNDVAGHMVASIEEVAADYFEVFSLEEHIYWLILAVHAGYAAQGLNERRLNALKEDSGIVVVDSDDKPFVPEW